MAALGHTPPLSPHLAGLQGVQKVQILAAVGVGNGLGCGELGSEWAGRSTSRGHAGSWRRLLGIELRAPG